MEKRLEIDPVAEIRDQLIEINEMIAFINGNSSLESMNRDVVFENKYSAGKALIIDHISQKMKNVIKEFSNLKVKEKDEE